MPVNPSYSTGTIAISGNTVTGTGTNFILGMVRAGDVLECNGLTVSIASVASATQLTLVRAWPGGAVAAGSAYEVRYIVDAARVFAAARVIMEGGLVSAGEVRLVREASGIPSGWSSVSVFSAGGVSLRVIEKQAEGGTSPTPQVSMSVAPAVGITQSSPTGTTVATIASDGTSFSLGGTDAGLLQISGNNILTTTSLSGRTGLSFSVTGSRSGYSSRTINTTVPVGSSSVITPTIAAIENQTMTVGDVNRTIPLTVTNAASISISPANQGVSISGTSLILNADVPRNATYTVTVTSSTGHSATRSFSFIASTSAIIPTIAAIQNQTMTVGDANRTVPLNVTNTASLSISPSGQGITISGNNLIISAATARNASYTVTATSSTGHTASRSFQLVVTAAGYVLDPGVEGLQMMNTYSIDVNRTWNWTAYDIYLPTHVGPLSLGDPSKITYHSDGSITLDAARGPTVDGRSWHTGALQALNRMRVAQGRAAADVHATRPNAVCAYFAYANNSKEIDFELTKQGGVVGWAPAVHMPRTGGGTSSSSLRTMNRAPWADRVQRLAFDLRADRCDFFATASFSKPSARRIWRRGPSGIRRRRWVNSFPWNSITAGLAGTRRIMIWARRCEFMRFRRGPSPPQPGRPSRRSPASRAAALRAVS